MSVQDTPSSPRIMCRLTTLFPSEYLEEHAEELGVVERDRKTQMPALVWAFVFGSRLRRSRTLAGFRRSYNVTTDETLSRAWRRVNTESGRTPATRSHVSTCASKSSAALWKAHKPLFHMFRFRVIITA